MFDIPVVKVLQSFSIGTFGTVVSPKELQGSKYLLTPRDRSDEWYHGPISLIVL